jgi:hypothetical protein
VPKLKVIESIQYSNFKNLRKMNFSICVKKQVSKMQFYCSNSRKNFVNFSSSSSLQIFFICNLLHKQIGADPIEAIHQSMAQRHKILDWAIQNGVVLLHFKKMGSLRPYA